MKRRSWFLFFFLALPLTWFHRSLMANSLDSVITKDNPSLPGQIYQARVIYVGENHTEFSNHIKQLEIIQALYSRNRDIVIGMEMFYRSDQKHLDDYISGKINEKQLLKSTGYFTNWGYNFYLYRDILNFAREKKIKVVGLNIDKSIIRGIGQEGFRSLNQKDMSDLPGSLDFGSQSSSKGTAANHNPYRDRLYTIFTRHSGFEMRSFQNFYLAQLIRDEYMAESVHLALLNTKSTMVVLAGNGHIRYRDTIPERAKRRNNLPYLSILLDYDFEPDIADYFIYTPWAEVKEPPLLGIVAFPENNQIIVKGFSGSEAQERHSLKIDDRIVSLGNEPVETLADVRLFLYQKKYGDEITIGVVREGRQLSLKYTLTEYATDTSPDSHPDR